MKTWLVLLWIVIAPAIALAHDSPVDAYGCHSNKLRFGNTTSRECHAGLLSGLTYTSTSAEYQAYIVAQGASIVSMQNDLALIKAKLLTTTMKTATLTWTANTESDLAGYRIYCGAKSGAYTTIVVVNKSLASGTVPNLPSDMSVYCAVTAYNVAGQESVLSKEVSKVMQ